MLLAFRPHIPHMRCNTVSASLLVKEYIFYDKYKYFIACPNTKEVCYIMCSNLSDCSKEIDVASLDRH